MGGRPSFNLRWRCRAKVSSAFGKDFDQVRVRGWIPACMPEGSFALRVRDVDD